MAVNLRTGRVAGRARLVGTNTQLAAAGGTVVATADGYAHIGVDPFELDPVTLQSHRRIPANLGYVLGMASRGSTVYITSSGGHFVAADPVDVSPARRVQEPVGDQIPNGATYVPGDRTVWVASNGLDCFDRRTGHRVAYSPGPADGMVAVEAHRILSPGPGTTIEAWTPIDRCATT